MLAILVVDARLNRRNKIETNHSILIVSIAIPTVPFLKLDAVRIANLQGCANFVSPLVASEREVCSLLCGKSDLFFIGPGLGPWPLTPRVRLFSYLSRSFLVAVYEKSIDMIESKDWQYSSVHPMAIWEFLFNSSVSSVGDRQMLFLLRVSRWLICLDCDRTALGIVRALHLANSSFFTMY